MALQTHQKTLFLSFFLLVISLSNAATITVLNQCSYTVWAAAYPGGSGQLNSDESWTISINPGIVSRIWARTNCSFDGNGNGHCQTGDCGGKLNCTDYGTPPNTLAEFALNQFNNMDYFDISLIDGFNVPMNLLPDGENCASRGVHCAANITSQCPSELQTPGGCNNACTVFKTDEYCCYSGNCEPAEYSKFFKIQCPEAYSSSSSDDQTDTFTCPSGTNYRVVLCPH